MTALVISTLLLWVTQIFSVIVIIGLARQIGVLHQRVRPLGPGIIEDGPQIGSMVDQQALQSRNGNSFLLLEPSQITLLAFASPHCNACQSLLESVESLEKVGRPRTRIIVAVDGTDDEQVAYLRRYRFGFAVSVAQITTVSVASRPYAVALAGDGKVLYKGIPNTLEQLEFLLNSAHDMALETPTESSASSHDEQFEPRMAAGRRMADAPPRTTTARKEDS